MHPDYAGGYRTAMESEAFRFADQIMAVLRPLGFHCTSGLGESDVIIKVSRPDGARGDVARIYIDPDWQRPLIQAKRSHPGDLAAIATAVDLIASKR